MRNAELQTILFFIIAVKYSKLKKKKNNTKKNLSQITLVGEFFTHINRHTQKHSLMSRKPEKIEMAISNKIFSFERLLISQGFEGKTLVSFFIPSSWLLKHFIEEKRS